MGDLSISDPEAEFLASKQETGNEWELYKENVRPLKRGRNVTLLNQALKARTHNLAKKHLLENRRRLIEEIDEYKGDDPLQPWLECIKWVQESFPSGGECSGLIVIYEQCVRTFWHSNRYKEDLRYLKVWLEYADNCADAEVIYTFLDANHIGQTHSIYYISYGFHMESKNKLKKADEIFTVGIARQAQPVEKLEAAYKKFLARSARRSTATNDEPTDDCLPARSFGTVLTIGDARRQTTETSGLAGKRTKLQRIDNNAPLSIYNDTTHQVARRSQTESLKGDASRSWHALGSRVERNKENAAIPSKWTSTKIPQNIGFGTRTTPTSSRIEVFVDDEFVELPLAANSKEPVEPSILQLRRGDTRNVRKETEVLREKPLMNFPPSSLPR